MLCGSSTYQYKTSSNITIGKINNTGHGVSIKTLNKNLSLFKIQFCLTLVFPSKKEVFPSKFNQQLFKKHKTE